MSSWPLFRRGSSHPANGRGRQLIKEGSDHTRQEHLTEWDQHLLSQSGTTRSRVSTTKSSVWYSFRCHKCGASFAAKDEYEVHRLTAHYKGDSKTDAKTHSSQNLYRIDALENRVKDSVPAFPHSFHFGLEPVDWTGHLERERIGIFRGIQGENNSCYLDAALFAMFFLNETFDGILHPSTGCPLAQQATERNSSSSLLDMSFEMRYAQTFLALHIVNSLRQRGFVSSTFVLEWRRMIDGQFGGGIDLNGYCERQESSEFVRFVLGKFGDVSERSKLRFNLSPLSKIHDEPGWNSSSNQGFKSHEMDEVILQLLPPIDAENKVWSTEQLLDYFLLEERLQFTSIGQSLVLQMPRYGSKERVIGAIVPTPFLYVMTNNGKNELNKSRLELRSVIVIGTGHFVTYVRVGRRDRDDNSAVSPRWFFFDSMSDRQGGQNIPLIEDVTNELMILEHPNANATVAEAVSSGRATSKRTTPKASHLSRITQDMSLVFYSASPLNVSKICP